MIRLAILLFFIFQMGTLLGQVGNINVNTAMQGKSDWCLIVKYEKRRLHYHRLKDGDTLSTRLSTVQKEVALQDNKSGTIPMDGDTVLIVWNQKGKVSLMAQKWDSLYYRIWMPDVRTKLVEYAWPAKAIPGILAPQNALWLRSTFESAEGCLYPIDETQPRWEVPKFKPWAVKLSVWNPGIGVELQLWKKLTLASTTVQFLAHGHDREHPVVYHSYKPYMLNELRYYFHPLFQDYSNRQQLRFSGAYASLAHVHSFNKEDDVYLDAFGLMGGIQLIQRRFYYLNPNVGLIFNLRNKNGFFAMFNMGLYL